METGFTLLLENGKTAKITFSVIEDNNSERPFGIQAEIQSDEFEEISSAQSRFFTYDETVKTMDYLCKHQVTPCTLCYVI